MAGLSIFTWVLIVVGIAIEVVLIVKFLKLCKSVSEIKACIEKERVYNVKIEKEEYKYASMDYILAYASSGAKDFSEKLYFAIYNDLYKAHGNYGIVQAQWKKLCEAQGWEYPSALDVNSMEFARRFNAKYAN
jgi:hypothetical protein